MAGVGWRNKQVLIYHFLFRSTVIFCNEHPAAHRFEHRPLFVPGFRHFMLRTPCNLSFRTSD